MGRAAADDAPGRTGRDDGARAAPGAAGRGRGDDRRTDDGAVDLTYLFAHRGGVGHRDNSLAAFADALSRGADLESDVRYSAGGVPVLIHDTPWMRWGLPVPVGQTPASWLRRLGAVSLAELFGELGSDFELSLDLKDTSVIAPLLNVLATVDRSRVWLVHSDLELLRRIRSQDPVVRLVHEAPVSRIPGTRQEHLALLASAGIDAQNTGWRHWTSELVEQAHALGIRAFGSIAQTAPDLAASGILDGIYSDHVQLMVDTLRSS